MLVRWTPRALAEACGGKLERVAAHAIEGVFIDSRSPVRGGLFVPIVAARDGHDFIAAAIDGGATAVLAAHGRSVPDADITVIRVADTLTALTRLATHRCAAFDGPIVGITGSNGKTTTRAMVAAVLGTGFDPVLCTRGNLNNHLGVPLTVLGEPHEPEAMVVELGMSAPGENEALARILHPTVHVLTSIGLEHLEFMGSIEAIAAAEAEPFGLVASGGAIVVPSDEPLVVPHLPRGGPDVVRFGAPPAEVEVLGVRQTETTVAELRLPGGRTVTVCLRLFGQHNARNAAAALAVGLRFGLSVDEMIVALENVEPVGDRGRVHHFGSHWLVADCYNANPGSVATALRSLAATRGERAGPLVAVIGDMLELGPTEDALHADVGRLVAELALDGLVGVGPRSVHAVRAAAQAGVASAHATDAEEAVQWIRARFQSAAPGVILIKGSRGMRLERVVEALLAD
jgi:UDP-N-acetylmuramoyl-tripeptide--D-alanyl-D-alanine ligase